jgi:Family of unknown function (DUF6370)
MKNFMSLLAVSTLVLMCLGCAQEELSHAPNIAAGAATPSMTVKNQVVDVGCAACVFEVAGASGCQTAIRLNGLVFLASGTGVPDAEDHSTGVCAGLQKARVSGTTVGNKFVATSFVLLP